MDDSSQSIPTSKGSKIGKWNMTKQPSNLEPYFNTIPITTCGIKIEANESAEIDKEKKRQKASRNSQCCHVFPARSSAFLVASPTDFLHLPNTPLTVSTESDHARNSLHKHTYTDSNTYIHVELQKYYL